MSQKICSSTKERGFVLRWLALCSQSVFQIGRATYHPPARCEMIFVGNFQSSASCVWKFAQGMPADLRASGRVGVPPAVPRVPRGTRRTSIGDPIALGVRVYSEGREIRQAGRSPYPMHAALLLHASGFHPRKNVTSTPPRTSVLMFRNNDSP